MSSNKTHVFNVGNQAARQERQIGQLTFKDNGFVLELNKIDGPLDRAKAYGRIAVTKPFDIQQKIDEVIKASKGAILTPLILLDTPGRATARVIILADPNSHEFGFEEDFM